MMGSTEKLSHPTRLSLFCFVGICVNHQSRPKNRRYTAERCANEGIDYARSSADKKNGFPMKDIALHPSKSDATVCWPTMCIWDTDTVMRSPSPSLSSSSPCLNHNDYFTRIEIVAVPSLSSVHRWAEVGNPVCFFLSLSFLSVFLKPFIYLFL